MKRFVTGTISF